ncbi:PREDICTED: uncharacterized protein LOC105560508 [Vollenhovia emeryi]|uniref:uncharacterized protein LOC105560508 n=1 Tax=Vollenhovia emeryi TaxID=411798 RepID=UPI0005F41D2A|nr:PREDICTED: uncharacterized protein LOC105560508 [Vollenhovia emeryi]
MESKTSNQVHIAYNDFFYATVCHVCKRFGGDVPLRKCSACKLIFYCSKEHQKQHWKQHKSLCNAVLEVSRTCNIKPCTATLEEWDTKKWGFMGLVSEKLGRPRQVYESEMFLYPKECAVCYKLDDYLLKDCRDCAASYCKDHIDSSEHKDICGPLGLCFRIKLQRINEDSLGTQRYFTRVSSTDTFEDMKDFIKTNVNIQSPLGTSYDLVEAAHSPFLTCPLTLFHAMRLLDYVPERKDLVVHVVGANISEERTLLEWGVFLNLIKISSLTIVLVGPELIFDSYTLPDCVLQQKECSFEFYASLYENYVRSSSFVKPDLVVSFNGFLHQHELESPKETWAPSIPLIAKQNCPFVLTWRYTKEHLEDEVERINTVLNRKIDYLYKGENPFACLRPIRVPMPQKVMYPNKYVIVYRSLCP